MLRSRILLLSLGAALLVSDVRAFVPAKQESFRTELKASSDTKLAAGVVAATLFVNAALTVSPAFADVDAFGGSSQVIAARSGGRMGGRSVYRAPAATRSYRSSTTIIRPMIAPPPVYISPFGGGFGFGYGYSPFSGFGLGYGLGAMNSAGDAIRDSRQETEIQRSRAELEQAKAKEAELEARLKALEQAQQPQQ